MSSAIQTPASWVTIILNGQSHWDEWLEVTKTAAQAQEECLFMNKWLLVFFYVDDIVTLYLPRYRSRFLQFEAELTKRYEMRNLGDLQWFLGIRVIRD